MNKEFLTIPKGIRYISDWIGYSLNNFPFPHILNKVITGCGYTEYCIRNEQNVILCSPRKMLLKNKEDQHPGEVFYARNDIEVGIDFERGFSEADTRRIARSLLKKKEPTPEEIEQRKQKILEFKKNVKDYVFRMYTQQKPCKILVTYDSFKHVKEAIQEMGNGFMDTFQIVVDEFQSIMIDVKFKSDTELEFLNFLQDLQKVCFVSATPMLTQYLDMLPEFKDLPYFEFDWETEEAGRIIRPNINVHKTTRVITDLVKIVNKYKAGKFEKDSFIDPETGKIVEIISNEAVLYVNSVKTICSVITKCELTPDQCNILIAQTKENNEKVRKAYNEVFKATNPKLRIKPGTNVLGDIPKFGEPHKMFTFCTRTVYLGADFYSTCARSFIFADSNIDCLTVDISMDLPQILGRQRLVENPWKNTAELYVKRTMTELTKADFDAELRRKTIATESLLRTYSGLTNSLDKHILAVKYEKDTKHVSYKDDYVAVNHHAGKDLLPVFNQLMYVSEIRTFDIQQIDYRNRFSVFNALLKGGFNATEIEVELNKFDSLKYFDRRLEYVCYLGRALKDNPEKFNLFLDSIPKDYKNYYTILGEKKCSGFSFRKYEIEQEYQKLMNNQDIDVSQEIKQLFIVGEKYVSADIKSTLGKLYNIAGYIKTPKASDIEEFFVLKAVKIKNSDTGKWENGFEIVSKK